MKNFVPELWSPKMLKVLTDEHVIIKNCTTEYNGEITEVGDKVHIGTILAPTIKPYVEGTTEVVPEDLLDESRTLEITEANFFAIKLGKIMKKQATKSGQFEEALRLAMDGFSQAAETFMAAKFTEGTKTITQAALTSGNFYSTFIKAKRFLYRSGVSKKVNIISEITPEVWEKGVLAGILFDTDNSGTIADGQFVKSLGITFQLSNDIAITETNEDVIQQICSVRTKDSLGYAEQILFSEKYKPEKSFQDAVKGLHVFGGKTMRPKQLVTMDITTAAETVI